MHHCVKFHQKSVNPLRIHITVFIFHYGGRLPYWIFKVPFFSDPQGPKSEFASACQISAELVKQFLRYFIFFDFQDGGHAILGFRNAEISLADETGHYFKVEPFYTLYSR